MLTWPILPHKAQRAHLCESSNRPRLSARGSPCYTFAALEQVRTLTERDAEIMARGREKDRKTRRKHRKNIQRLKALAKARRSKKGKKA